MALVPPRSVIRSIPATAADPTDPPEGGRPQPTQGDLRHDHHRDQPDHPWPDVDGDPRVPTRLEKRVTGIVERSTPRELGHLAQHGLVDAEIAKLLRVRYHQAGQLRAHDSFVTPLGHPDQVDAFLWRGEATPVSTGCRLLKVDDRPLAVRRDHPHLGVEEVDELALAVDGVDHDLADVVVPLHEGDGIAARAAPEGPPRELSPELVEVPPAQPQHTPLRL